MSILQVGDHPDDVGYAPYGQLGAAHSVSAEPQTDDDEAVRALRKVVEEITGKEIAEPEPRRIGFI